MLAIRLPLGQGEVDPDKLAESGISEVTTGDAVLAGSVFLASILLGVLAGMLVRRAVCRIGPTAIGRLAGRVTTFVIVAFGFFYALAAIDVRVGPLVGALGIAGIALAFAMQEILSNFVAGVLLQIRRPFSVGDQIASNGIEGRVEDVDFRVTRVRSFDGEEVVIPNSMVLSNPITNWTRTPNRRTTLEIGVAYDDDLAGAQRAIIEAVRGVEEVKGQPDPQAWVYEFGENSINIAVQFWHRAEIAEMWRARDAVAQAVKKALDENGHTMPFPQRTVWFGPGNTELRIADRGDRDR